MIQSFRLRDRSRESVQHITVFAVVLLHAVGNKIYDQFIRNEKSLIHISFCFLTEFGSVLDICPENVSC